MKAAAMRFVIAESCPLRHSTTRGFPAFEQQPRVSTRNASTRLAGVIPVRLT